MAGDAREVAKKLAKTLGPRRQGAAAKIENGRRFVWVKRQVSDAEAAKVKALQIPGIGFAREPKRFYPQREPAAHVIGMVGTDGRGLEGLEQSFEDELSGERISARASATRRGRKPLTNGVEDPIGAAGASVTLTIDSTVQYATEKALEKPPEQKATAGMAVVLDPKTGEILALANWPRFNPNAPKDASKEALRNRAVTDPERAWLDDEELRARLGARSEDHQRDERVRLREGAWAIGRHVVHDTHLHGPRSRRGAFCRSAPTSAPQDRPAPRPRSPRRDLQELRLR